MNRIKRFLKLKESSNLEAKKLRRTSNEQNNRITCIEHLSSELFYEIFEYLDGCDINNAFSNLNLRIQHLITCSPISLKIKLRSNTKLGLEHCCKNIIIPNRHNILSLNFESESIINAFFKYCVIDCSFDRLESIVLGEVSPHCLMILLFYLKSLPKLFSLIIFIGREWDCDLGNIYRLIFSLSSLKYNKLSLTADDDDEILNISVILASNERFSTIEYLHINHNCTFNELISILHHTPRLHHLTCANLLHSDINTDIQKIPTLPNLTYLCIDECELGFEEFEIFITKISSQLQVLNIKHFWHSDYLWADRWEPLIKKCVPHLRRFDLEYFRFSESEEKADLVSTKLNAFTSSFWVERQWFLEIEIDDHSPMCSIRPYKTTWVDLYNNDETIASFNQSNNLIGPNQNDADKSSTPFLTSTQLIISWTSQWDQNQLFINKFKSIFVAIRFTRLNINDKNVSIGVLCRIIQLLPNLDSIKLSSLLPIEPGWLVDHDGEILFSTSISNKITKVNFEKIADMEQVHFLFYLCRHIQYFQVNIPADMDLETLVRFILLKARTYISHLTSLCIYIANAKEDMITKLQNSIGSEELMPNYTIKFISSKILVKCKYS